jgi:hypothetical protein
MNSNLSDYTLFVVFFTEKMAPPAAQIRHDGQKVQGGKFEGEPTYACK